MDLKMDVPMLKMLFLLGTIGHVVTWLLIMRLFSTLKQHSMAVQPNV